MCITIQRAAIPKSRQSVGKRIDKTIMLLQCRRNQHYVKRKKNNHGDKISRVSGIFLYKYVQGTT